MCGLLLDIDGELFQRLAESSNVSLNLPLKRSVDLGTYATWLGLRRVRKKVVNANAKYILGVIFQVSVHLELPGCDKS